MDLTEVANEREKAPLTEHGNARRFADAVESQARYCHSLRTWFVWDGKRWAPDEMLEAERLAKESIRAILGEALIESDDKAMRALVAWEQKSETEAMIRRIVSIARTDERLRIRAAQLDADPWLLNVQNGTLDLRTSELREPRREDYITRISPAVYDPQATCPLFDGMLQKIFDGRAEIADYLARWAGYSLTGSGKEQAFLICWGSGANGKSTLLEVLRFVLGDYARQADFATFLSSKNDAIRNDIARLEGTRLVTACESEANRAFAESLIKQLTGGDTVTARMLYREAREFRPAFKLWLASNHLPTIHGTDAAIWRRIRLLPFTVQIPAEEQDKDFPDKLRAEASGILNWMLRGLADWQKRGLDDPATVAEATLQYRTDEDRLRDFLDERCVVDRKATTGAAELYRAYSEWADAAGERPVSKKALGLALKERGFTSTRGSKRRWRGIRLTDLAPDNDSALFESTEETADGLFG